METAPLAFISYSWDHQPHINWVLELATRLRSDGIDVVLDRWDTRLGSDLGFFMEQAGDSDYRVIAIVTSAYRRKADEGEGGVGYEKRVMTASIMRDLHGHRVVPVLRNNPERALPRFLGTAKYVIFEAEADTEHAYYELLQDLHGIDPTPKPPLGRNPFATRADEDPRVAVQQNPARYLSPALEGVAAFNYTNNNGRYTIGAGERSFTLAFSPGGHGMIWVYNSPADIKTIALAPHVTDREEVGDASIYDGSSRTRLVQVGDSVILRNRGDYWAAAFIDEVTTRETDPTGEPRIRFRYFIPPTPDTDFA